MLESIKRRAPIHLGSLILLLSAVTLGGCGTDHVALEDDYVPAAHYENYPIKVATAPYRVGIAAKAGRLTPEQINAAKNFAHDARNNAQSKVAIRWPSGGAKSRRVAHQIAQIFAEEGVQESMIRVGSYPAGASAPIRISYERKVAVTRECGDWSSDLGTDSTNSLHLNHGCAAQHNIAAMVARPEDFERPRAMSPIEAANRTAAMNIYYLPSAPLPATSRGGF